MSEAEPAAVEQIEIDLLLEALYRRYGYDFRQYSRSSLGRRIHKCMAEENLQTISALQDRLLRDRRCLQRLYNLLSINVTSMFRDPPFYLFVRNELLPRLRTYPFIRIWHAGCSTGEEVYSVAIILLEDGILDRCRIYATDMNPSALGQAKSGVFSLQSMTATAANYLQAGGRRSFSDFYTAHNDQVILDRVLTKNAVFAHHNLVTDTSFNEFNLILCRNVLIYFSKPLQERVQKLFYDSLAIFGILALGRQESLRFSAYEPCYELLDANHKVYRKVR